MRLLRRAAACWSAGASLLGMAAATPALPPVTGELQGELRLTGLPALPPVRWKLNVRAGPAAERVADLELTTQGARARGEARLATLNEGTWRLAEGELDAAEWLGVIAAQLPAALASARGRGAVGFNGEGTWKDTTLTGRLAIELRDGSLASPASAKTPWRLEGVKMTGAFRDLPAVVTDGAVKLTFREAAFADLIARDGTIEFSIDAQGQVQVARASCAMLGGTVEITPFSFPLNAPAVQSDVHFDRIELGEIAAFLPPLLASAAGKVSGRMALRWSARDGVEPGTGRLQIDPGSKVAIRLQPQPGFFTANVPPKISLLPFSLGPFAKLATIENPAYGPLRAIEMGEAQLEVNALDIGLRPEGDPEGRTARIVFTARPEKRADVESVRFEINIRGPLADVLQIGLEHNVKVKVRSGSAKGAN